MKERGKHFLNKFSNRKKELFKDTSKEERAKALNNVICPRCKYQNHEGHIKKYGKCNLCGAILDKNYFKRTMYRRLKNEKNK